MMSTHFEKKITRRVTIKNLAEDLGLSVGAVSQALNPRDNINIKLKPETIERVRSYATQLNYRPHAGASSIRSRHFSNIGYFVAKDDPETIEPAAAQFGIHDAALEHNFRVTMVRLPSLEARNREVVSRVFQESHLDALIVLNYTNNLPDIYQRVLNTTEFPIIHLNTKQEFQSIYVDNEKGASLLTEHLISQGYQKILFVKHSKETSSVLTNCFQDRYRGYQNTMEKHGLLSQAPWIVEEMGESNTLALLKDKHTRPEAIIAYSDSDASRLCGWIYQLGLRMPDDIAVGGFGNEMASQYAWVPLTTIDVPYYQMAYAAFNRAVSQITHANGQPFPSICVEPKLIIRQSTLCTPKTVIKV